jgi:hypothetical protein
VHDLPSALSVQTFFQQMHSPSFGQLGSAQQTEPGSLKGSQTKLFGELLMAQAQPSPAFVLHSGPLHPTPNSSEAVTARIRSIFPPKIETSYIVGQVFAIVNERMRSS